MQKILTERPNLFEPNDYIILYIELSGKIHAEDLKNAIEAAYQANEATMSKIVLRSDGVAHYEKMSQSNCKVEILQGDWKEIMLVNEKYPFQLEKGELIRSFIIPDGEKISFMIMAHHLAGDGKAIIYFIEDIMMALSGRELTYKPLSLLTRKTIPKIGKYPIIARLYPRVCNWIWMKIGSTSFFWEDYYNIHKRYWEATSSYVEYKQFSKEETTLIMKKAKQIGVSVNSYIIAAFLQADRNNHVVGIPVSVRENGNKSMTNLTSGISITHLFTDKDTFMENSRQIQQKVSKELAVHRWFVLRFLSHMSPTLIDGVLLYTHHCYEKTLIRQLSKAMGYTGEKVRDLGITNLTVLDIPATYGKYNIEKIIFVPPNVSYSRNIIGVSTFNEEMTVTYHGAKDKKDEQEAFFNRGIKNLKLNSLGDIPQGIPHGIP